MAEYIEREAISQKIRKYYYKNPPNSSYGEGFDRGLDRAQREILNAPAADVAPVRHGRWMKAKHKKDYWGFDSDGDFGCWSDYPVLCSSCKYDATENSTGETNYCPNCGAKMEQEDL